MQDLSWSACMSRVYGPGCRAVVFQKTVHKRPMLQNKRMCHGMALTTEVMGVMTTIMLLLLRRKWCA